MNFSTIEPDGQGTGRGLILSAIYLANPGGVPQCDLRGEREGVGGGGCGTLWARLGWLTHRQISSGSGPICPEQVCFKPATGVCLCVCSCLRVCEDRVREQEKTGNRFPWLARCWPRSYLDTLTFCFCLAVQSEHGGLFTHKCKKTCTCRHTLSSSLPNPPNPTTLFAFLFSPTHSSLYWPAWPRCLSLIDLNIELDGRDTSPGKA